MDADLTMNRLTAMTLAGFPVVLVLAWMYDVSSKGIQRTELEVSGAARTKLRLLQALGLVLSFGVAGLIAAWVLN